MGVLYKINLLAGSFSFLYGENEYWKNSSGLMSVCDDNSVEIYWRYIWKDHSGYAVLHESLLFLGGWWQKSLQNSWSFGWYPLWSWVNGAEIVLSLCCHEWCFFLFPLNTVWKYSWKYVVSRVLHHRTDGSFPFCLQVESTALPSFMIYVFLNSPEPDFRGEMIPQDICLVHMWREVLLKKRCRVV